MSQRASGYERLPFDSYQTPAWVTAALIPHIFGRIVPRRAIVHEPAAGHGNMVRAMQHHGIICTSDDIELSGTDFLLTKEKRQAIITNPPYSDAERFIEHALRLTEPFGLVAMLLRADYDSARSRTHLFDNCPAFAMKIVLLRRIQWFDKKLGGPSFNHAWYVWDHEHTGPTTLGYAG